MITDEQHLSEAPQRRRRWPWLVLVVIGLFAVGWFLGVVLRPHVFNGTVIQASTPAPSMEGLVFDDGVPVDITSFDGEVVLVYFGYTHCPDLCPTTLSTANKALALLGEEASRVNTLMVTVDPERDALESLGNYVRHFNDSFRGVWGEESQLRSVASSYGVYFEHDDPADGDYLVSHTASLLVIDPDGVLRLTYPVGFGVEELAADLEELLG